MGFKSTENLHLKAKTKTQNWYQARSKLSTIMVKHSSMVHLMNVSYIGILDGSHFNDSENDAIVSKLLTVGETRANNHAEKLPVMKTKH